MNENKIYNTPIEIGIRLLNLMVKSGKKMDFDKLIILDYLSLHSNIIDNELKSLHPDNPCHGLEVYSKIDISKNAINLLISKGLIDISFTEKGITYSSNLIGKYFLSFFEGEYYEELQKNVEKIIEKFNFWNSNELQEYIFENIEKWNGNNRDSSTIK